MKNKRATVREIERKTPAESTVEKSPDAQQETSFPVIEEHLNIDKKTVETGRYQIKKTVSREEFSEEIPAVHEKVNIRRVPIDQYVDNLPEIRHEGDTTIIPVLKEVVVVEKKMMLVEEIHITKTRNEVGVNVKDTLRKEHIDIRKSD